MIFLSNLFVVSDIHGHIKPFEEILTYWNRDDILVILGDLVDRGPQSLQVIEKVIELKQTYGDNVVFVKGNHEEMLLNFLEYPNEKQEHYYKFGGKETMQSLLAKLPNDIGEQSYHVQAIEVQQHYKNQLDFIQAAPVYKIIGNVLLTHAGFNSEFATLEETTEHDFIWIRKHYEATNKTPYVNVFGHTPLKYIHDSNDVWLSEDKRYIAIDGGYFMTGQMNAIRLNHEGELLEVYTSHS